MKRFFAVVIALLMFTAVPIMGHAFFLNFENGTEGANVIGIPGVTLESFNGYSPLYGNVLNYNTHSDDLNIGYGTYHMMGNYFVWASAATDARGVKVDFTNNDGTWFKTGYASYSNFIVEAWLTDGTMVSVTGAANTGSPMGYLQVNAGAGKYIDYVVLHDSGNYWLVDDMSGDASGVPNQSVPEPASMLLLAFGLAGLVTLRKKF